MNYEIKKILDDNVVKYSSDAFIFEKHNNTWQSKSYGDFTHDVKNFAAFLQHENLAHKKIAIYATNSYNYLVCDAAIMAYVGISVTISKDWTAFDLDNSMRKIKYDAIIYDTPRADIVAEIQSKFPDLKSFKIEEINTSNNYDLDEDLINCDDVSKIVFSSGTTGTPKAVMLTQRNMLVNFENLNRRAPMSHADVDYLFLPLSHTYASISNFMSVLITGMRLYLCSDIKQIATEIQEVKPTIFCAVPLIFERFYQASKEQNINPKTLFGGQIRHLFAGGAHMDTKIIQYFKQHHTGLLNTYGLSETSAIVAVEYHNEDDFDSDGTIFENIEVKIDQPDDDGVGEILVRGENVTPGYYNNPELAKQAIDEDGFFHTGDLGKIIDQKIYVKGRKKRVILLSNGENIYPDDIEPLLEKYEHVNKAKVYEKNHQIFAMLYCDEIIDLEPIIENVNLELPKYSRIQGFDQKLDQIGTRIK